MGAAEPNNIVVSRSPAYGPVPGPELTVIIPTRNECDNVGPLYEELKQVLAGVEFEVLFADDDSTDGTIEQIRFLASRDRRVRLLHRIGRRGLSSACVEAAQASTAPFLAVMDADLQHDETLLPKMLAELKGGDADIVVGSRYIPGGGTGEWDEGRVKISGFATSLSRLVLRSPIADPMSGFFMLRREAFDGAVRNLSARGFKILVDLLASSPRRLKVSELPYHFRPRVAGASKLDAQVAWEYLLLLLDKTVGRVVPIRFILFSMIGSVGLGIHLMTLFLMLKGLDQPFLTAQFAATTMAMACNFVMNNQLTYGDRQLKSWRVATGLASFGLISMAGAFANIATATYLLQVLGLGKYLAGFTGAVISAVWNYAVSSGVTWRRA
jgi:dolichol-phosphate mannosyltransferase